MDMDISYQLFIEVTKISEIQIGKLGCYTLPKGLYIYTGSARKNIDARINRHIQKEKKLKWHIDYITIHKDINIIKVLKSSIPECELNKKTLGVDIIPGFGSSDCKNRCISHFKRV